MVAEVKVLMHVTTSVISVYQNPNQSHPNPSPHNVVDALVYLLHFVSVVISFLMILMHSFFRFFSRSFQCPPNLWPMCLQSKHSILLSDLIFMRKEMKISSSTNLQFSLTVLQPSFDLFVVQSRHLYLLQHHRLNSICSSEVLNRINLDPSCHWRS